VSFLWCQTMINWMRQDTIRLDLWLLLFLPRKSVTLHRWTRTAHLWRYIHIYSNQTSDIKTRNINPWLRINRKTSPKRKIEQQLRHSKHGLWVGWNGTRQLKVTFISSGYRIVIMYLCNRNVHTRYVIRIEANFRIIFFSHSVPHSECEWFMASIWCGMQPHYVSFYKTGWMDHKECDNWQ
jgi:hypothetical protein